MTIPDPRRIERSAERLREEIERLEEEAREVYREVQDVEAERPPNRNAALWIARARLGDIEQRLLIAQCELVPPTDSRWSAAQRTSKSLRDRLIGGPLRGRIRKHARSRLKIRAEEAA